MDEAEDDDDDGGRHEDDDAWIPNGTVLKAHVAVEGETPHVFVHCPLSFDIYPLSFDL